MEVFRQVVPYVASAGAVVIGLLAKINPPVFTLSGDLAIAMIVGGFAGLGVSVAVPAATRAARREGETRAARR